MPANNSITTSPAMSDATLRNALGILQHCLADGPLNSAGIAIGSSSKKAVKIANTVYAVVNGVIVKKTTAETALATAQNVTNAKFNILVVSMAADGTVSINAGTEAATIGAVVLPSIAAANVVLGFVILNPTGTGNFVGGTTDLDDATVVPNAVFVSSVNPFEPFAMTL